MSIFRRCSVNTQGFENVGDAPMDASTAVPSPVQPRAAPTMNLPERFRDPPEFAVRWAGFEAREEGYYADPHKMPR